MSAEWTAPCPNCGWDVRVRASKDGSGAAIIARHNVGRSRFTPRCSGSGTEVSS